VITIADSPVERIVRTIFRPTKNFAVKHQVQFGNKNSDLTRKSELYVSEYNSQKYSNISKLSSLYLESSDYLVFQYGNKDDGEEVFISYPHIFKVIKMLKESLKWFYSDTYKDLFFIKKKKLRFNPEYSDMMISTTDLISNKILYMQPSIIVVGEESVEGALLFFNESDKFVEMTYEQIEGLYFFLKNFNLYECSQLLINFVYTQDKVTPTISSSKGEKHFSKMQRNK